VLAGPTPGDVVMVTRLDRLARSTRDLLNMLVTVAEKKAGFRSLGDPWAGVRSATKKPRRPSSGMETANHCSIAPADRGETGPSIKGVGSLAPGHQGLCNLLQFV